jgi:cytochrome P450
MVHGDDPAWADCEQALRESLAFLIGGIDTSTQSVAHGVRELSGWFAAHPEDRELLSDREFMAAFKESLRLPRNPRLPRTAGEDTILSSGIKIKKGQRVAISRGLCNRDETARVLTPTSSTPAAHPRATCPPTA